MAGSRRRAGLGAVGLAGVTAALVRRRWWSEVVVDDLLGAVGGPMSKATAINDWGVIVGSASGRGFRWHRGNLRWLTELGTGSWATGLADDSSISGAVFSSDDGIHPVRWSPSGRMLLLDLPGPRAIGAATATSTSTSTEVSVGWCADLDCGEPRRPWVWRGATGGRLPVPTRSDGQGEATAVNCGELIVGWAQDGEGNSAGLVWYPDGTTQELVALAGGQSRALSCSDDGVVVGSSSNEDGDERACIWYEPTTEPYELGTLGGAKAAARSVSRTGTIAGWSLTAAGHPHACVWKPSAGRLSSDGPSPPARRTYTIHDLGTLGGWTSEAAAVNGLDHVVGTASRGRGALNAPLRPGGWSWEERAFHTTVDDHEGSVAVAADHPGPDRR